MFTVLLATAAALTGLVSAQNSTSSDGWFNSPIQINPGSVDLDLRRSWCTGQRNNCPKICAGPDANPGDADQECDPNLLTYTCTCTNGNQPNISDYTETLPFFICGAWRDQCTAAHPDDLSGQTACQSVTCGERNASSQANASPSASSSGSASEPSSTASSTSDSAESSGSASASASASDAASSDNAATSMGMNYGTGILMAGMLAVFGLAL